MALGGRPSAVRGLSPYIGAPSAVVGGIAFVYPAMAALAGVAMNLLAWGVLGFDQITRYRELIARWLAPSRIAATA